MARVPNDLRQPEIRKAYLENHIDWFLKNHEDAIDVFRKAVIEKYGHDLNLKEEAHASQSSMFGD